MNEQPNPDDILAWQSLAKDGYTIYQSGSHIRGNFVQLWVPDSPYQNEQGKLKLVTYLHGFALCLPQFYTAHLEKLVKQGYVVVFPDFQKSDYSDHLQSDKLTPSPDKRHFGFWYQMAIDTITNRKEKPRIPPKIQDQTKKATEFNRIRQDNNEPDSCKCLFIALAIMTIITVVKVIYFLDATYSKNLVKLISTVGLSLLYHPATWMETAIDRTTDSWQKLCQVQPGLSTADFDFYVFGHSLGGLLALSWPAYVLKTSKFYPQQILTADPAPTTEMGIPAIASWILRIFRSPFTLEPITIKNTGAKLQVPVGILHGADDKIVPPQTWIKKSLGSAQTNFEYIASTEKQIYFSLSDQQSQPPLEAFHNQAVTDTSYFSAALFKNFGGVKDQANAYNYEYIWPGLDLVIENKALANELLTKFPLILIKVTNKLPPSASSPLGLPLLILVGGVLLAYWLWRSGAIAL